MIQSSTICTEDNGFCIKLIFVQFFTYRLFHGYLASDDVTFTLEACFLFSGNLSLKP